MEGTCNLRKSALATACLTGAVIYTFSHNIIGVSLGSHRRCLNVNRTDLRRFLNWLQWRWNESIPYQ
jgi:hypothetical protein